MPASPPRFLPPTLALSALLLAGSLPLTAALARSELTDGSERRSYDVVVVGAGTGGTSAALQAARLGAKVLLVESTDWIGGQMAAAGVSSLDEGFPPRARVRERGVYGEFHSRAVAYYRALGLSTDTCGLAEDHCAIEPRIAQRVLRGMIDDTRQRVLPGGEKSVLDLRLRTSVVRVHREGNRVAGVVLTTPDRREAWKVDATVVIDATEYGDLLPLAAVRYRVANRVSDQSVDAAAPPPPVQDNTWTAIMREYPEGVPVELRLAPPPGYDEAAVRKYLTPAGNGGRFPWDWSRFVRYRGKPDSRLQRNARNGSDVLPSRTHINFPPNDQPFDAGDVELPDQREDAEYRARLRTLGVLYYIQSAMGVNQWAVANDEGYDTPYNQAQNEALIRKHPELASFRPALDHLPVMAYVRESRRLVGVSTLRARDIRRKAPDRPLRFSTAIALGDYPLDVHGGAEQKSTIERDLDLDEDFPARFGEWGYGPFQIPLETLIPETVDGFLAAEKNLSQSRIVNGATRLQPVTMLTGQAAGALAALSVRHQRPSRKVPPLLVQEALLEAGSTLALPYYTDLPHGTELWREAQLTCLYGLLDVPEPLFQPTARMNEAEIAAVRDRLSRLDLPGANGKRAVLADIGTSTTRREMVRQIARALRTVLAEGVGR